MSAFDARITAARGDIAAASLRGKVEARNFVEGVRRSVKLGRTALRAGPSASAGMATELLFGENVHVYESKDGWAWLQSDGDGYVGYAEEHALGELIAQPAHRVIAPLTPLLPSPDVKRPALDLLPMNALVHVGSREGRFLRIAPQGYVFESHLAPVDSAEPDFVAVAQRFMGAPYIWGGKTWFGLDCSGLIQTALTAARISCPRDSDMQEEALGRSVAPIADGSGYMRGDLIFWRGHAGIMLNGARLLHANAYHMAVAVEPLAEAVSRIEKSAGPICAVRRLL